MFDPLRIEGEDGGLVASDQEEGRHSGCQRLQPSHVQRGADDTFARHWQRPEPKTMQNEHSINLITIFVEMVTLCTTYMTTRFDSVEWVRSSSRSRM